ncbi:phosphate ABC transporter substrate-binding protein [Scytonema sp. UIC 10036]|uniref:PstS family phosphate ABC transporter substrate-binding protein n=1 Tax=Scytonema sp. UIC 10036 TaxID=2304196 RepID=UPI0012DAB648|nr:PstS family phosphate ABC transporter substrate-binding protein [Scytonema sp. UIC 10036]MUG94733.1 phosphate ABC transporter substrate-binding protein [Scytonema sp. UIC 10036]
MSQNKETPILLLSLLITVGLIAGGYWWFSRNSNLNLSQTFSKNAGSGNDGSNTVSREPIGKTFASVQNVPIGTFKYGGSTSWAPIRGLVDPTIQSARPEFRLQYVQPKGETPGSGTGIKSLIDGQLVFAQSSRPLNDKEKRIAQQRGFTLEQIPVAIDGLAVAVNPNLNISGLTINQLKSIYTGKVTNWKELGGPDVPLKAFSRRISDGGTVEQFVQDILGGEPFGQNVVFVSTTTQALQNLTGSPGGIYYASAPEVVPQCSIKPLPLGRTQGQLVAPYQEPFVLPDECPGKRNQLNTEAFRSGRYPITRTLFVVIKQTGQIEQQAGMAYANLLLTEQGQELVTQAGFVKIR